MLGFNKTFVFIMVMLMLPDNIQPDWGYIGFALLYDVVMIMLSSGSK